MKPENDEAARRARQCSLKVEIENENAYMDYGIEMRLGGGSGSGSISGRSRGDLGGISGRGDLGEISGGSRRDLGECSSDLQLDLTGSSGSGPNKQLTSVQETVSPAWLMAWSHESFGNSINK